MKKTISVTIIGMAAILSASLVLTANFASPQDLKYDSRGKRDPFVPLIGPDRTIVAGLEDIMSIDDVRLEGIAIGAKGQKIAILNGEMLKEGQKVGNFEIKEIQKKAIILIISDKEYNLKLPEEGGIKSAK